MFREAHRVKTNYRRPGRMIRQRSNLAGAAGRSWLGPARLLPGEVRLVCEEIDSDIEKAAAVISHYWTLDIKERMSVSRRQSLISVNVGNALELHLLYQVVNKNDISTKQFNGFQSVQFFTR